jgi:hypothetical protein
MLQKSLRFFREINATPYPTRQGEEIKMQSQPTKQLSELAKTT